jgi:alkanesulfonate monooxygenase SsuD/methylene tetrahydromethanopterin reductase-like flavin-dependent oxidoreductase (luciferase family)
LNVIAALLPGPWNPAVAAKQIASIDHYTNGRISVNVVSGWFKAEFTSIGHGGSSMLSDIGILPFFLFLANH